MSKPRGTSREVVDCRLDGSAVTAEPVASAGTTTVKRGPDDDRFPRHPVRAFPARRGLVLVLGLLVGGCTTAASSAPQPAGPMASPVTSVASTATRSAPVPLANATPGGLDSPPPRVPASGSPAKGPIASPTQFPARAGAAWMGAGPDGGVWILADHPSGGAVETNVAVLGLLDRTGRPRAGWPVRLDGWRCGDDAGAPGALPVSADGSIRLVCAQDTTSDGPQHHTAFAFSPDGNVLTGWPVALPGDAVSNSAVVVGNELRILNSEVASTEGQDSTVQAAAWWLTSVSASGDIRVGDRYSVADAGGNFDVRMAANGFGYRLEFIGRPVGLTMTNASMNASSIGPCSPCFFTRPSSPPWA